MQPIPGKEAQQFTLARQIRNWPDPLEGNLTVGLGAVLGWRAGSSDPRTD
jgi:hypothetical protein